MVAVKPMVIYDYSLHFSGNESSSLIIDYDDNAVKS